MRALALVGLVTMAGLAAACNESTRDRSLTVHSSLPAEATAVAEGLFEAEHPDVDVRIVASPSDVTLDILRGGGEQVDVWWGAPVTSLILAEGEALLGEQGWDEYLVSPFVIAFNRERLPLSEAPRDWIDLFHHAWADEIVLPDPATNVDMTQFLGAMLVESLREANDLDVAFDWALRLDRASRYERDVDQIIRDLDRGQALLSILPRHVVETARRNDAPWLHYRAAEGPTPQLAQGVAVMRSASDPALAAAFVRTLRSSDVLTSAVLHTHWAPVGAFDASVLPADFELDVTWEPAAPARDTLAAELDTWLDRWEFEVRGKG